MIRNNKKKHWGIFFKVFFSSNWCCCSNFFIQCQDRRYTTKNFGLDLDSWNLDLWKCLKRFETEIINTRLYLTFLNNFLLVIFYSFFHIWFLTCFSWFTFVREKETERMWQIQVPTSHRNGFELRWIMPNGSSCTCM